MARLGAAVFVASVLSRSVEGARINKGKHSSKPYSACGVQGAGASEAGNGTSINIINGKPAEECTWRWHVGLQRSTNPTTTPWCGGALISPEWVLTAAHCVHQWSYFFDAVLGLYEPKKPDGTEERRKVVNVIRHPRYVSASKSGWDFALLRLQTPIESSECVGTVCLPEEGADVPPGTSCAITGWGRLVKGRPDVLQHVTVNTLSPADCVSSDRSDYNESQITPEMLCAQGKTEEGLITDACTGDSGGPLVCKAAGGSWTLYGSTSWGKGCGEEKHPGVWSRTHSVLDWIDETMAANTGEPTPPPGMCPFFTFRPNQDKDGHCQCGRVNGKYYFCSLNGVDENCPTSEGPGGRGGSRFFQTCEDCQCYPPVEVS